MSVFFCRLLKVDALHELFEILFDLRCRLVLDVNESLELADRWLARHVSFQTDRSQTTDLFAEALFALADPSDHRRKLHNLDLVPLVVVLVLRVAR